MNKHNAKLRLSALGNNATTTDGTGNSQETNRNATHGKLNTKSDTQQQAWLNTMAVKSLYNLKMNNQPWGIVTYDYGNAASEHVNYDHGKAASDHLCV